MSLDRQQQAVLDAECPAKLVAAGPGSGKTRLLVAAVLKELDGGTPPARVLLVTYTVAAAVEMRRRVEEARPGAVLGHCGTLHSLALKLARQRCPGLAMADEEAVEQTVAQVAADMGVKAPLSTLVPLTRRWDLIAAEPGAQSKWGREELVAATAIRKLQASQVLTFESVLHAGLCAARHGGWSGWQFVALFVDEAQDMSTVDATLYVEFARHSQRTFMVGDPNQGVYGFRGGDVGNFVRMAGTLGLAARWFRLESNYRSGPEVCDAATRLISNNTDRIPKSTVAVGTEPSLVRGYSFGEPHQELGWVLAQAAQAQGSVAVLARTNKAALPFRLALESQGLAERRAQGLPHDWGKAKAAVAFLAQPFSQFAQCRLVAACFDRQMSEALQRQAARNLTSVREAWEGGVRDMAGLAAGVLAGLSPEAKRMVPGGEDYGEALEAMAQAQHSAGDERARVHVGTVHSAKGLEWDHVLVVGCEEGWFPSSKGDLQEERRLFYVALTRARRSLSLSWCGRRPQDRGPGVPPGPVLERAQSRFVVEAGVEVVEP